MFDHPYCAVTGEQGRFRLPPAPAGRYTLHIWHDDGGLSRSIPVELRSGESDPVRVEFGGEDLHLSDRARAR